MVQVDSVNRSGTLARFPQIGCQVVSTERVVVSMIDQPAPGSFPAVPKSSPSRESVSKLRPWAVKA